MNEDAPLLTVEQVKSGNCKISIGLLPNQSDCNGSLAFIKSHILWCSRSFPATFFEDFVRSSRSLCTPLTTNSNTLCLLYPSFRDCFSRHVLGVRRFGCSEIPNIASTILLGVAVRDAQSTHLMASPNNVDGNANRLSDLDVYDIP